MLNYRPMTRALGRLLLDPGLCMRFESDPAGAMKELSIELCDEDLQSLVRYMRRLQDNSPLSHDILTRTLQSCDRTVQR